MARSLSITWLGHATFILTSPGGKRIVTDPWLEGNPSCPESMKKIEQADLILLSHGHFDHVGDAVTVARATGATVVGIFELCAWLEAKGVKNTSPMNIGGTQKIGDISVTMTMALHSSGTVEDGRPVYLGEPAGYVISFEDGVRAYFAGDTALFSDMRLIKDLYAPQIAFLPIGDHFTMGPDAAARACEMLGVKQVVPMHWGTFPLLTGTPERLKQLVEPLGLQVLALKPGQTAQ
ncbi:MAG TPA: metal-dependent hydrolase [Vicinamibacterales bacterium]|nr:metal-dependent hydrolase [Vicinamibacterales bacterium]